MKKLTFFLILSFIMSSFPIAYAGDIHPGRPFLLHQIIKKLKEHKKSQESDNNPSNANQYQTVDTEKSPEEAY